MNDDNPVLLNRRRIIAAALASGGAAALSACTSGDEAEIDVGGDIWAGYDDRITERTLAEAEKLFGLQFSEAERQTNTRWRRGRRRGRVSSPNRLSPCNQRRSRKYPDHATAGDEL